MITTGAQNARLSDRSQSHVLRDSQPQAGELADPSLWHEWAVEYSKKGNCESAATFFRHAIVLDFRESLLWYDYGVALLKCDRKHHAIEAFDESLRLNPGNNETYAIISKLQEKLASDELRDQENEMFIRVFSPKSTLRHDIAACDDFIAAVDGVLSPQDANATLVALADKRKNHIALQVAIANRIAGTLDRNAARHLKWMTIQDGQNAKRLICRAVAANPEHDVLLSYAKILQALGLPDHAKVVLERCLVRNPGDYQGRLTSAEIDFELGNIDDGLRQLEALVDEHGFAAELLALQMRHGSDSVQLNAPKVESILEKTESPSQKNLLRFSLARYHERYTSIEKACEYYSAAAETRKARMVADGKAQRDWMDRTYASLSLYDHDFFAQRKDWGNNSMRPVFIVGMPRSGTTLTEQILASHPDVYGAGELHDMSIIARRISVLQSDEPREAVAKPHSPGLAQLTQDQTRDIARQHLDSLNVLDRDSRYVIDKMPTNFLLLGLIGTLFPNAIFLHCKRNLLDICVSCYRNNFSWPFFDIEAIAEYSAAYELLMEHWRHVLPCQIVDVQYENTVQNFHEQVKGLLDALGLPSNESCFEFHKASRAVRTPSKTQVRKPIYATSIGMWRKYENQIKPLLKRFPHHIN